MRNVHDWIGKLNTKTAGLSITELDPAFTYISHKLNAVPYGVRNTYIYSQTQMQQAMN